VLIAFSSYEAWVFGLLAFMLMILIVAAMFLIVLFKKPKGNKSKNKEPKAKKTFGKKDPKGKKKKNESSPYLKDQKNFDGKPFVAQRAAPKSRPATINTSDFEEPDENNSAPKPVIYEGNDVAIYDDRLSDNEEDTKFLESLRNIQETDEEEEEEDYSSFPDETPSNEAWSIFANPNTKEKDTPPRDSEYLISQESRRPINTNISTEGYESDDDDLGFDENIEEEVPSNPTPIESAPEPPLIPTHPTKVENSPRSYSTPVEPPVAESAPEPPVSFPQYEAGEKPVQPPEGAPKASQEQPTPNSINNSEDEEPTPELPFIKTPPKVNLHNTFHPVVGSAKFTEAKEVPTGRTIDDALAEYDKLFRSKSPQQKSGDEKAVFGSEGDLGEMDKLLSATDESAEGEHDYSAKYKDTTEEQATIFMFSSDDFSNELD